MSNLKSISVFVAFCFSISIFWCIDFDCVNATAADQCVASLNGSLGNHENSSTNSNDNHSNNCSCICHAPSIEYKMAMLSYSPSMEIVVVWFSTNVTSAPSRTLFRPPIAA